MNVSSVQENSIRVLVADDYPPFADLLAGIMRGKGYTVQAVHDGGECLREAESFRPHALIADMLMNGLGGRDVADMITDRFPNCRVLLISASPNALVNCGRFQGVTKFELGDLLFEFLAGCEADE